MQQARGGMGSRKHGVSGCGGPSPKAKINRARDANAERDEAASRKVRKKSAGIVHGSVSDAVKHQKRC